MKKMLLFFVGWWCNSFLIANGTIFNDDKENQKPIQNLLCGAFSSKIITKKTIKKSSDSSSLCDNDINYNDLFPSDEKLGFTLSSEQNSSDNQFILNFTSKKHQSDSYQDLTQFEDSNIPTLQRCLTSPLKVKNDDVPVTSLKRCLTDPPMPNK